MVYYYFNKLLHFIHSRSKRINIPLFLSSAPILWWASVKKQVCINLSTLACYGLGHGILVKGRFRAVMLTLREACALDVVTSGSPGGPKPQQTRDGHSRPGGCSSRPVLAPPPLLHAGWGCAEDTAADWPYLAPRATASWVGQWGFSEAAPTGLSAVSRGGPPNGGEDHPAVRLSALAPALCTCHPWCLRSLQVVPQVPEAEQWHSFHFPATPRATAPGSGAVGGQSIREAQPFLFQGGRLMGNIGGRGVSVAACTQACEHGGHPASRREPGHLRGGPLFTNSCALVPSHVFTGNMSSQATPEPVWDFDKPARPRRRLWHREPVAAVGSSQDACTCARRGPRPHAPAAPQRSETRGAPPLPERGEVCTRSQCPSLELIQMSLLFVRYFGGG